MKKKKDLYLNYIFEFILNFRITQMIWPTFLIIKGYSLIDVGICESLFHVVSMLGEWPTGIVSDLYGRRLSRMLGRILDIISILLLVCSCHIVMVFLSFAISALSYNLESGTDSAYVYDLLLEMHQEKEFSRIQGIREIIISIATFLSILVGGFIASYSYEGAYIISIGIVVISIIVLRCMKEIKNVNYVKTNMWNDVKNQVITSYSLVKKDKQIIQFILSYALFSASLATAYYYITNYWTELGIDISKISLFLSFENLAGLFAGVIAYQLINKYSQKHLLLILPLGVVIGVLVIPYYPISIGGICIMAFFESLLYIAMTTFLNERVTSQVRSTLLSTMSMGYSLIMIIYFPIIGFIGNEFGLKRAFIVLGLVNILIYVLYQKIIKKIM